MLMHKVDCIYPFLNPLMTDDLDMTENVDPETASDHLAYFERLFVDYVTERLLDLLHLLLVLLIVCSCY
jgi:hypothetical protein